MDGSRAVVCFFALFITVYFLESIGGFYMTSAVVSIEKQFQIPSRMSGLMVSAGDFGYIPSVIFVSYLGGKGNRARWIGGGCSMIAIANVLISSSNFLFPVESVRLNSSFLESTLEADTNRLSNSIHFETFLVHTATSTDEGDRGAIEFPGGFGSAVLSDEFGKMKLKDYAKEYLTFCYPRNMSVQICKKYFDYLHVVNAPTAEEISNIRILTGAPFAFCSSLLNSLRSHIDYLRCSKDPSNFGPFLMIFGGLLILGVGRTMPFSLGLPLVDDNVKRKNLPIYFAGMFFIRILGPVLGFMIGSITNKYYYSFDVPPGLSPRDPMWIGRWWAGFLGIGVCLFGPSLALYLFPSTLKKKGSKTDLPNGQENGTKVNSENGTSENGAAAVKLEGGQTVELEPLEKKPKHKRNRSLALFDRNIKGDTPGTVAEKVSDFVSTVKKIIRAPVFMGALVGRILDVLAFKGFFVFLPKYLEVQFGLPQHKISLFMGIVGVTGFALGVIIGSVSMRKLKLQGRKAAAWVAVCSTMAALLSFVNSGVGCKSALSQLGDYSMANGGQFNNTCNSGCSCEGVPLYPVCNRLGQPFFSPCQAGCPLDLSLATYSTHKVFTNCACSNSVDKSVSRDYCDESECEKQFKLYFFFMAISGIFGGMGVIPAILIILRSVPPAGRSVSLGFQGFLVSLLATLPSPVIWGWIVDRTCVLWNDACGNSTWGACAIYDTDRLRLRTHITYGILRLISLTTDIWVFFFAKGLVLTDEEPEPNEEVEEITDDVIIDKDRKFSM